MQKAKIISLGILLIFILYCYFSQRTKIDKLDYIYNSKDRDSYSKSLTILKKYLNLNECLIDSNLVRFGIFSRLNSDRISLEEIGPHDYYMICYLKLYNRKFKFDKINTINKVFDKNDIFYRNWLPQAIKDSLFNNKFSININVYSANPFFKEPFNDGFLINFYDSSCFLFLSTE